MHSSEILSRPKDVTGEIIYPAAEVKKRNSLIAGISTTLKNRSLARSADQPIEPYDAGPVSILETLEDGQPSFTIALSDETITYRITENGTIRKEGFFVADGKEIHYFDRGFSESDKSDSRIKPSLEVDTEELEHLAYFIQNPSLNLEELDGLKRLPKPERKIKPVQKTFPTLSEAGPSSVNEFPKFIPALRKALGRKGRAVFKTLSYTYLRDHPDVRQYLKRNRNYFREHDTEVAQQVSDLDQICAMLNISSPADILKALSSRTSEDTERVNDMICREFSTSDNPKAIIEGYAATADKLIASYLRLGILNPLSHKIGMREEVQITHDILTLLDLMFNHKSKQVRFEAKRKLILMKLVAEMSKRDEELKQIEKTRKEKSGEQDIEGKKPGETTDPFVNFLNANVWTTEKGEDTEPVLLVSKHDPHTYECIGNVEEFAINQEDQVRTRIRNHRRSHNKNRYYLRATEVARRHFDFEGEAIPAGFESRPEKDFLSMVLKMFRKGEFNPEKAVQDMKAWKFMVRTREDAIALKRKIELAGKGTEKEKARLVFPENTEDTSGGQPFSAVNEGSSDELFILKYDVLFEGVRMEIQISDYKNFLDSENKDILAHEDFELNRLLESGAFEGLFPESIYEGVNADEIYRLMSNQQKLRRRFDEDSF